MVQMVPIRRNVMQPTNPLESLLRSSTAIPETSAPMQEPVNLLQQLTGGQSVAPSPAQQSYSQPKRERRSFLETLGRVADVIATVGGADPLYSAGTDGREDRQRQIDMDALRKQQLEMQIASGSEEASAAQRGKVGVALKGLQAIQARGGDISRAWPILAQQAGLSPEQAAQLGQVFQQDPNAIAGMSAMFGSEREFGLQPFFAQDAEGNLTAYQLGKDGSLQPIQLPDGSQPIDPLKFVDTGNQQVGVGTRSGRPVRILPKGVDPNTGARIASGERIAGQNNRTRITIAGMRQDGAGDKSNVKPSGAEVARGAAPIVAGLRSAVERLYKSGGMTDEKSGILGTAGAIARENIPGVERFTSPEGFSAREDFTRLTTVGIPALLPLMGGLTLGGKNIDAAKELETWRNAIASAKDYPSAMRAIQGFENRIKELSAGDAPKPAAAPRASGRKIVPQRGGRTAGKPTVSNW